MTEQEMLEILPVIMAVIGVSIFLMMVIPIFIYATKHTRTEEPNETALTTTNLPIHNTGQRLDPGQINEDINLEAISDQALKLDLMALESFRQMLKVSKKE